MTQEFKKLMEAAIKAKSKGLKTVLATVVDVDGSAYRGPGVRMLIIENSNSFGAVSGGCVEHDIQKEAELVFRNGYSRMMNYDGRYRLGCEGTLYILLEPFFLSQALLNAYSKSIIERDSFKISATFKRELGEMKGLKSSIHFGTNQNFNFSETPIDPESVSNALVFHQELLASLRLIIFGTEHDATQLCILASLSGWEVEIVSSTDQSCNIQQFPGAKKFETLNLTDYSNIHVDEQTAIVIMSHNYASDLGFLLGLQKSQPFYLGILGSAKRKEKLMGDFYDRAEQIEDNFLNKIHAPAGLNIGAITPQEIGISILAEMLTVHRQQEPMMLCHKEQKIHA